MWARGRCRISPPGFLAECCKRQLNRVSLVLLYFRLSALSDLYWVCLSVFSCTVLFVSISQLIGCEDRLRNDLYCVGWGIKLYSNQTKPLSISNNILFLFSVCYWPYVVISVGICILKHVSSSLSSLCKHAIFTMKYALYSEHVGDMKLLVMWHEQEHFFCATVNSCISSVS